MPFKTTSQRIRIRTKMSWEMTTYLVLQNSRVSRKIKVKLETILRVIHHLERMNRELTYKNSSNLQIWNLS